MFIKKINECPEFIAGDGSILRELIHADREDVNLRYSLAEAKVLAGETTKPHRLNHCSEVYYILKGKGIMHIDKEERQVETGDLVYIKPGASQFIKNTEKQDLIFLCIVDPAWRIDNEEVTEKEGNTH